ncbi:uncharacterized protein LOC135485432 isoform X2 [Lineus longissimus]|uniref:uncharacterized protein LOC135485432 isoform X2 n=1 Tax=Lineus longissimus TaxID=88925 RepID=UPI00315CBBD4
MEVYANRKYADKDTFDSIEMASQKEPQYVRDHPIESQPGPARPYVVPVNMVNTVQDADLSYPTNFSEASFDPASRSILQSTYRTHYSHRDLNRVVLQHGAVLQQNSLDSFASLHDRLSYDQLLQGLLFQGEKVLNENRWLYYSCVEFRDEKGTDVVLPPMTNGKACLTDQRLLLLSAERGMNAGFSMFGNPKKTPGGYHVETLLTDTVHYKPIPLSCFYSVELHIASGSKSEVNIHAKPPWCCGLFGRCCTGNWTKQWSSDTVISSAYNQREITLGVTLPPWGMRAFIRIHLNPNMPLAVARDFVSCLQCFSRNLH